MDNTTKKNKSENLKFAFIFTQEDIAQELISAYLTFQYNHLICTERLYGTIGSTLQAKANTNQENITSIHQENNNVLILKTVEELSQIANSFIQIALQFNTQQLVSYSQNKCLNLPLNQIGCFVINLSLQEYGIYLEEIESLQEINKNLYIVINNYQQRQDLIHNHNHHFFSVEVNNLLSPLYISKLISQKNSLTSFLNHYLQLTLLTSKDYTLFKIQLLIWFQQITKIYPKKTLRFLETNSKEKIERFSEFIFDSSSILSIYQYQSYDQMLQKYDQILSYLKKNQLSSQQREKTVARPLAELQQKDYQFDYVFNRYQELFNAQKEKKQDQQKPRNFINKHNGVMKNLLHKQRALFNMNSNASESSQKESQEKDSKDQTQEEKQQDQSLVQLGKLKLNDYLCLINSNPFFYHLVKHHKKSKETEPKQKIQKVKPKTNNLKHKGVQTVAIKEKQQKKGRKKVIQETRTQVPKKNIKIKKTKKVNQNNQKEKLTQMLLKKQQELIAQDQDQKAYEILSDSEEKNESS